MGIGAVVVGMVTSFTVVTVFSGGAVPDSVSGVELFTKSTAVREWERASGAAGRCFLIVVLGLGRPLKAVVAGVFFGCG